MAYQEIIRYRRRRQTTDETAFQYSQLCVNNDKPKQIRIKKKSIKVIYDKNRTKYIYIYIYIYKKIKF